MVSILKLPWVPTAVCSTGTYDLGAPAHATAADRHLFKMNEASSGARSAFSRFWRAIVPPP
jgi:hypothetical protein